MFYQYEHVGTTDYFKREEHTNFSYPTHLHRCYELIAVTEGEMSVTVDNTGHLLHAGDMILIFPNQLHSLLSWESQCVLFIFSPKLINSFSTKYADSLPVCPLFSLSDAARSELLMLSEGDSQIALKAALYTAMAQLERTTAFRTAPSVRESLLVKIFNYVDTGFRADCSLPAVAHALGYDAAYLSRYFKRASGIPYTEYVNIVGLNHAGHLLTSSELSVLECAIDSGYSSLRTFNRNFKSYFGSTPIEYRTHRKTE
jgi:AraC-like DNA-binding protein